MSFLNKLGHYGIRIGTALATGGGSELYRATQGHADPLTGKGEQLIDRYIPGGSSPASSANAASMAAFNAAPGQLDAVAAESDLRRKQALKANLAMFDPVDSIVSRMYGPGAVAAPVDIDALFGTLPQQKPGYYQPSQSGAVLNDPGAVQGGFDTPTSSPSLHQAAQQPLNWFGQGAKR